jgi:hypothetical protein
MARAIPGRPQFAEARPCSFPREHGTIAGMNFTKNIGMLLLAIYLIIVGIVTLTGLGIGYVTGVIALVAGIFILIGR